MRQRRKRGLTSTFQCCPFMACLLLGVLLTGFAFLLLVVIDGVRAAPQQTFGLCPVLLERDKGYGRNGLDNPSYCTAWWPPKPRKHGWKDCCWIADENSALSEQLSGVVSVKEDGKIHINYNVRRESDLNSILIPLVSPWPDRIQFDISRDTLDCNVRGRNDPATFYAAIMTFGWHRYVDEDDFSARDRCLICTATYVSPKWSYPIPGTGRITVVFALESYVTSWNDGNGVRRDEPLFKHSADCPVDLKKFDTNEFEGYYLPFRLGPKKLLKTRHDAKRWWDNIPDDAEHFEMINCSFTLIFDARYKLLVKGAPPYSYKK